MPCYEIRTVTVEFKIENFAILKKAIENEGFRITEASGTEGYIAFRNKAEDLFTIKLKEQNFKGTLDQKQMIDLSNQIKRAYSRQVISEVAQNQKWFKKEIRANNFVLQRY